MKVFVSGSYSAHTPDGNVIEILGNMRRGLAISIQVMQAGHSVFAPWLDFTFGLIADLPMELFKRNSMDWVRVSDAILLLDGWRDSAGCRAEALEASLHGVPTFEAMDDLLNYGKVYDSFQDHTVKYPVDVVGGDAQASKTLGLI